ncbi:hypothetical protein BDQ17DRAFT_1256165, partial [Cyathus striatus]
TYELNEDEWHIIEEMCKILKILKDATLVFSCVVPNIANVIPVMDIINDKLTSIAIDHGVPALICTASGLAKKTLNRYYSQTDESEAYRIAMSNHSICFSLLYSILTFIF